MNLPHCWLGQEFRELLGEFQARTDTVKIAVTRPSGRSYGEGALRVVRVTQEEQGVSLVLAYERYLYLPRPDQQESLPRGGAA